MRAILAALALTTAAAPALAETRFDLDCTGTRTLTPAAGAPAQAPWTEHFRVDLPWGEYCQGDCSALRLVVVARPDLLVFDAAEDALAKDFTGVSRATGEFYSSHQSKTGLDSWEIRGTCQPAPFTPLPTAAQPGTP